MENTMDFTVDEKRLFRLKTESINKFLCFAKLSDEDEGTEIKDVSKYFINFIENISGIKCLSIQNTEDAIKKIEAECKTKIQIFLENQIDELEKIETKYLFNIFKKGDLKLTKRLTLDDIYTGKWKSYLTKETEDTVPSRF